MVVVPSGRYTKTGETIWRAETSSERVARQTGGRAASTGFVPAGSEGYEQAVAASRARTKAKEESYIQQQKKMISQATGRSKQRRITEAREEAATRKAATEAATRRESAATRKLTTAKQFQESLFARQRAAATRKRETAAQAAASLSTGGMSLVELGRPVAEKAPQTSYEKASPTLYERAVQKVISKIPKRVKERYTIAEEKVSAITRRVLPEWTEETTRRMLEPRFGEPVIKIKAIEKAKKIGTRIQVAVARGFYKEIRQKPLKTVATTAAFALVPGGLGVVGKAVSGVKFIKPVTKGVSIVLPVAYGYSVEERIRAEPTLEARSELAGRIIAGEMVPMGVGYGIGVRTFPKIGGMIRTIGRKHIPIEKLVPTEVLMGKKMFPEAPPKIHLKLFKEDVWHATPEKFAKVTAVKPGVRELPGLYVSPELSPYFLRVAKTKYKLIGEDLFPAIGSPMALKIKPTAIKEIPATFKSKMSMKQLQKLLPGFNIKPKYRREVEYILRKAKPGEAIVPKLKREIEAVIKPETELVKLPSKYYTKYEGVRIPIEEYRIPRPTARPTVAVQPKPTKATKALKRTTAKALRKIYEYKPSKKITVIPYLPPRPRPYKAPPSEPYKPYKPTKPYKAPPSKPFSPILTHFPSSFKNSFFNL